MRCIRLRYRCTSTRGCILFLLFSTSSCHKSLHAWSSVMEPVSGASWPSLFLSSSLSSSHSNDDRESLSDITSFSNRKENVGAAVCPCEPLTGRMVQEMGRKVRSEPRNWNIFSWLQKKQKDRICGDESKPGCQVPGALWFLHHIHPFGVYLSKYFKSSACQEIKITLIFTEISHRHQSQTTSKSCRQWTY